MESGMRNMDKSVIPEQTVSILKYDKRNVFGKPDEGVLL